MTVEEASDAALLARARAGDGEAFTGLYDRYADRIHSYCFRRTGSWATAQDLTSAVWLEAWRGRDRAEVHEDGSLSPWLFGVARNVIRNSERSLRRHRAALRRLPGPMDEPDHAELVTARLDDERRMAVVLEAVSRLPRREQDVLSLVAWADLSHAEIAAALGISVGTVKSRLSRARARLRLDEQAAGGQPPPAPAPTTANGSTE
jgi:RNA polymerase sigma factor (sigma-70 family)